MSDLDGDTRDIIALQAQHPAEHHLPAAETEKAILAASRTWIKTGIALAATAVLAPLITALFADNLTHVVVLLVAVSSIALGCTAGAFLTAALIEYTQRPTRTLIRRAMARADGNADIGTENGRLIDRNRRVTGQLAYDIAAARKDITGHMARLEKRIADMPDYATGVEHGLKLRRDMFGGVEGFDGVG